MLKFFKDKTSKSDTDKGFKLRANVILRFNLLVIFLFTTLGIFIIGKAAIIMFVERDYWNEIKEKIDKLGLSLGMTFSDTLLAALETESAKVRLEPEEEQEEK